MNNEIEANSVYDWIGSFFISGSRNRHKMNQ